VIKAVSLLQEKLKEGDNKALLNFFRKEADGVTKKKGFS
jgi:hypothetical protein